ncbi:MAG: TraR/DksA family transcriptional regulator [Saprospiraceae bacterium]
MSQDLSTTVRYSDDDLAEFKAIIEKKIKYAKADLAFYMDSLKEMADNPDNKVKDLDDGTLSAEVTRLNTLASRQEKHVARLENAAQRIESKTYGVCRETGSLIPKDRLKAVPHATLSVEAKMAR